MPKNKGKEKESASVTLSVENIDNRLEDGGVGGSTQEFNETDNSETNNNIKGQSSDPLPGFDLLDLAFRAVKQGRAALVGALLAVEIPEELEEKQEMSEKMVDLREKELRATCRFKIFKKQEELLNNYRLSQKSNKVLQQLKNDLESIVEEAIKETAQEKYTISETVEDFDVEEEVFVDDVMRELSAIIQKDKFSIPQQDLKEPRISKVLQERKHSAADEQAKIDSYIERRGPRNTIEADLNEKKSNRVQIKQKSIEELCKNKSLLPEAYQNLDDDYLVRILKNADVLVTEKNGQGDTLLHVAAKCFHEARDDSGGKVSYAKIALILIGFGADLSALNGANATPADCMNMADRGRMLITLKSVTNPKPSEFYQDAASHIQGYEKKLNGIKGSPIWRRLHNKRRLKMREEEVEQFKNVLNEVQELIDDEKLAETIDKLREQTKRGVLGKSRLHDKLLELVTKYKRERGYGRQARDIIYGISQLLFDEEKQNYQAQIVAKEDIIKQKEDKIQTLQSDLDKAKVHSRKLEKLNENLRKDNADLKRDNADLRTDNADLRTDNDRLRKDHVEIKKQNKDLYKEFKKMEKRLEDLEAEKKSQYQSDSDQEQSESYSSNDGGYSSPEQEENINVHGNQKQARTESTVFKHGSMFHTKSSKHASSSSSSSSNRRDYKVGSSSGNAADSYSGTPDVNAIPMKSFKSSARKSERKPSAHKHHKTQKEIPQETMQHREVGSQTPDITVEEGHSPAPNN